MPRSFKPRNLPCLNNQCTRLFTNNTGRTNHYLSQHAPLQRLRRQPQPDLEGEDDFYRPPMDPRLPDQEDNFSEPPTRPHTPDQPPEDVNLHDAERIEKHLLLNGLPCDVEGHFLPPGSPPPPWDHPAPDDFTPFDNRGAFELADLLYRREQMPRSNIDSLLQIWAAQHPDDSPPFQNSDDLYSQIDATPIGGVPWQCFAVRYNGDVQPGDAETAPWKSKDFEVWFRDPRLILHNHLSNPDFANEIHLTPIRVFDSRGRRRYKDFMSGNWAWRNADLIARDPSTHGATFCPIILGSDKTTVSVGTGHTEYYPIYISNGQIFNSVRRAHRNAVALLGFLAIPKTDAEHKDSVEFRNFRRSLFHGSIARILESLRPAMTTPEIVRYGDGHYRKVIYGIGPYIADYPEQVLLACIVQGWCPKCTARFDDLDGPRGRRSHEHTLALFDILRKTALWEDYGIVAEIMPFTHHFPRADIHELLAPDLLHQIIKGTFKDHLVTWINEYLYLNRTPAEAERIIADIDRRIAVVPPFPGLRRFPEGRGFKQWTGDDSKALMKVYLPAISGHVPPRMVQALQHFLEFCFLARRSVLDEEDLTALDNAVSNFHRDRIIFEELGVRPNGFSLPRQHSLTHYRALIQEFGAPNGLCSSITESKHIKAVKEPWRRSNRYEALGQMLTTNQRLDKLAAARIDFQARGMLNGSLFQDAPPILLPPDNDDDDGGAADDGLMGEVVLARKPLTNLPRNAYELAVYLNIPTLPELISRFLYQQAYPNHDPLFPVPLAECPRPTGAIRVFPSAVATFFAPSDKSGVNGMYRERIRSVSSWRKGPERRDCIFVSHDETLPGFRGLIAARVLLFFSITHERHKYSCALVTWFSPVGEDPCPETGLWVVVPDLDANGHRIKEVINLDAIVRGAHLIGRAGDSLVPHQLRHVDSLDVFREFYVNKYIDHHSHEIAF